MFSNITTFLVSSLSSGLSDLSPRPPSAHHAPLPTSLPPRWGRMGDSLSGRFHDTVKRACEWAVRGSWAVRGTLRWLIPGFTHSRGWAEPPSPFLLLVISFGLPSLFLSFTHSRTRWLAPPWHISQHTAPDQRAAPLHRSGQTTSPQNSLAISRHSARCSRFPVGFSFFLLVFFFFGLKNEHMPFTLFAMWYLWNTDEFL